MSSAIRLSRATSWKALVTTTEQHLSELQDNAKWEALLKDPRSISLLEQMGDEALAEDDAGLTIDLDKLL